MDILFLTVFLVAGLYWLARLTAWALREDRKERDKQIVDELERWMNE